MWKWPQVLFTIFLGCIGATCPCFLFGKNAQFLGSGTLAGSCTMHCMLWGLLTSLCCVFTGGLVLAVPGSAVACYACGYRSALRTKYNLPEAPCGDLTTHLFCHLCAICQEYREIRERTGSSSSSAPNVTPPPVQTMDDQFWYDWLYECILSIWQIIGEWMWPVLTLPASVTHFCSCAPKGFPWGLVSKLL